MKSKTKKREELQKLEQKLPKSEIVIFTTFSRAGEKGLSVAQMQELKRTLRAMKTDYVITKKNLVNIAVKDLKYDGVDVHGMNGSIGIALSPPAGGEDGYVVAKKIYEFAKKNPALQFFGAWFDGKFMPVEAFREMALMPSREELLARLAGMLRYPLTGLAIVLKLVGEKR